VRAPETRDTERSRIPRTLQAVFRPGGRRGGPSSFMSFPMRRPRSDASARRAGVRRSPAWRAPHRRIRHPSATQWQSPSPRNCPFSHGRRPRAPGADEGTPAARQTVRHQGASAASTARLCHDPSDTFLRGQCRSPAGQSRAIDGDCSYSLRRVAASAAPYARVGHLILA
jgi:hypothetical protein